MMADRRADNRLVGNRLADNGRPGARAQHGGESVQDGVAEASSLFPVRSLAQHLARPLLVASWTGSAKARITLYRYFTWWLTVLLGLMPAGLRRRIGGLDRVVILDRQTGDLRLLEIRPALQEPARILARSATAEGPVPWSLVRKVLGKAGLAPGAVHLGLPAQSVLERTITLPNASRNALEGLIAFDLDQWMPLTGDQVHTAFDVLAPASQGEGLQAVLGCVRREALQVPWLENGDERLGAFAGFACLQAGSQVCLAFQTPGQMQAARSRRRSRSVAAALAVAVLAVLFAGPWIILDQRHQGLSAEMDEIRAEVQAHARENRKGARQAALADGLSRQLLAAPAAPAVLARLTSALPDGTWVEDLTWRRTETGAVAVVIRGQSDDVSGVLDRLGQDAQFHDVQFAAPTAIVPATGLDRFAIEMTAKTSHGPQSGEDRP